MQFAVRVVDLVTLAQGIQTVLLSGMLLTRHHQGVGDRAQRRQRGRQSGTPEFIVEKRRVERSVVNQKLRSLQIFRQFGGDLGKALLRRQEFACQAVHLECAGIAVAVRVQVPVLLANDATIAHLDAADFDNAVVLRDIETGGLGVEHDLSRGIHGAATPEISSSIP